MRSMVYRTPWLPMVPQSFVTPKALDSTAQGCRASRRTLGANAIKYHFRNPNGVSHRTPECPEDVWIAPRGTGSRYYGERITIAQCASASAR